MLPLLLVVLPYGPIAEPNDPFKEDLGARIFIRGPRSPRTTSISILFFRSLE